MNKKLQQYWIDIEKKISHDKKMPEETELIIMEIQQALSIHLKMRKWIPFGSVHCGLGIKGQSDWDFLAIIPVKELIFSREPIGAVRRLETILNSICDKNIEGKLNPPAYTICNKNSPENKIDIVVGISRIDLNDSEKKWDTEVEKERIELLDCEPYFFTGSPSTWEATSPEYHNTFLDKLDASTNCWARTIIKLLKVWKFNNKIPIRTFFLETFVMRWFQNTYNIEGTLGDILEQIEGLNEKYYPNQIQCISDGIELIIKDLYKYLNMHFEKENIPKLYDPCVYAGWSYTYACDWIYELSRSIPIFVKSLDLIKEAREFEKENEDNKAILCWDSFLGIPFSHLDNNFFSKNTDIQTYLTKELSSVDEQLLKSQVDSGVYHCRRGSYEEAILIFNEVLKSWPTCEHALNNKAAALGELKRHNEAIEVFDKLLKMAPDYNDGWFGKANSLLALGNYHDAIICYDKAIQICRITREDETIDYWYNKGIALHNLGFIRDMNKCYEIMNKIRNKNMTYAMTEPLPLKLGILPSF